MAAVPPSGETSDNLLDAESVSASVPLLEGMGDTALMTAQCPARPEETRQLLLR
jgi:hypothetical protein